MNLTNKFNLPIQIVEACKRDDHRVADFSVTQLLKGATEIALEKKYADNLSIDVSENLNALFGTAFHKMLEEKVQLESQENEKFMTVLLPNGYKVSGISDCVDYGLQEIVDYKTCSVWKFMFKDFEDWRNQTKCYNYLLYATEDKLFKKAKIIAFIKDWSQREAEKNPEYPQCPIQVLRFEFTENEILSVEDDWTHKTDEVKKRLESENWGVCEESERWAKPRTWAVMKNQNKKAEKVFQSEDEAQAYAEEKGKGFWVQERAGEDTKCDKYCIVGKCGYCPYKNMKEQKEIEK